MCGKRSVDTSIQYASVQFSLLQWDLSSEAREKTPTERTTKRNSKDEKKKHKRDKWSIDVGVLHIFWIIANAKPLFLIPMFGDNSKWQWWKKNTREQNYCRLLVTSQSQTIIVFISTNTRMEKGLWNQTFFFISLTVFSAFILSIECILLWNDETTCPFVMRQVYQSCVGNHTCLLFVENQTRISHQFDRRRKKNAQYETHSQVLTFNKKADKILSKGIFTWTSSQTFLCVRLMPSSSKIEIIYHRKKKKERPVERARERVRQFEER